MLDDRSKAVGTAAQFVDVPAVGDGRLAVSGVGLFETSRPAAPMKTAFAAGSTSEYRCTIYDSRNDRTRGLTLRADVLRDGSPEQAGSPSSIAGAGALRRPGRPTPTLSGAVAPSVPPRP